MALVGEVGDRSAVALFRVNTNRDLASLARSHEDLLLALELRLEGVLLAKVDVVFHVILGKLAGIGALALGTVGNLALGVGL